MNIAHNDSPHIWLHIGAGSFHRAHQAWYLHRLIISGDKRWSIALANIRNDANPLLTALSAQNGKYTLETVTPAGVRKYETITSISKVIPWDAELAALVAQGADPATGVISFTVTEGGYYLDPQFNLDRSNSDLQTDLNGGCCTIYGAIARILRQRKRLNAKPVTLLNCDNLRHNGDRFRKGLLEFLSLLGEKDLIEWVNKNTTSPNTMVDRITPRPSTDIAERVMKELGIEDSVPVMGEAFIQWVIEDNFIAGRPALENAGVELVRSVLPYEEAKIRILNASHSCIAWAGTLIGQSYIHESTLTPDICRMAYDYVTQDVIPSLQPNPLDLEQYRDVVLDRFSNPYILDTNQRVAADGFSKIPGFITPTLIECYARGQAPAATCMLPALFFVFMNKWHNGQLPYTYQDGILDEAAVHSMFNSADPIAEFAHDPKLFGPLAQDPAFEQLLRQSVDRVNDWVAANQ